LAAWESHGEAVSPPAASAEAVSAEAVSADDARPAPSSARHGLVDRETFKKFALLSAVGLVYFIAGKVGLYFAAFSLSSSPIWPPAGIAAAALLLGGFRLWPAIFLAAFFVNVTTSGTVYTSLGIAAGNTLEAIVGVYLTAHYANGRRVFERTHDFFRFVAFSVLAAAVSPTIGLASLRLGGFASSNDLARIWLTWWVGDMGGFLLVAPAVILWIENPTIVRDGRRLLEKSLTLVAIVAVGVLVLGGVFRGSGNYPIGFVCIPILVWSAFRFGQREAATCNFVLAASAAWGIMRGMGPWSRFGDPINSFIIPQAFMITMAVMTLAMAAAVWERKRAEAEAKEARGLAQRENRAKDRFLAMLGHELRNPLGALTNAIRLVESGRIQPEQAIRVREIIGRQVSHLARLVDDLLDVGRLTTGRITLNRKPLDLAQCARACVDTLRLDQAYATRNISLDIETVWVDADRDRVEQILTNLLSNALNHTRPDGRIVLGVRAEGDRAVIRAEDDGDGISGDLLERVFDLFVQGDQGPDRPRGGLGIGLTLVRWLVELHGGTAEVHSGGLGQGSTFTIRMPRIEAPLEHSTSRAMAGPSSDVRRRILIVEDNADAREALRAILEQDGHEIFEASSGPDGVASALANHPEIALIDLGLPVFDGYEVARRIRAASQANGIVLIAVSGYGLPEDQRKAEQAGFDAHLVKPVDLDLLTALLERRESDDAPAVERAG
jgi:signal transduction histidine kinase/CheY-like chemotaxis protein